MENIDTTRWVVTVSYILTAIIGIAISIPLWLGKVAPNGSMGFRTQATLADPQIWYRVNTRMGLEMLILNIVLGVAAIILHNTIAQKNPTLSAIFLTGGLVAGYGYIAVHGWYLSTHV